MRDGWLICDDLDVENSVPITREFLEKHHVNFDESTYSGMFEGFHVRDLLKYGIYITNNARKMHGETMTRRIAGRKKVRKPKPRKQFKTKGVKKRK